MKQYIQITKTDALSFLLFIFPLVFIAMGAFPFIFGDITFERSFGRIGALTTESSSFYLLATCILIPFALFFYLRRLLFIRTIINNGGQINGIITDIQFTKDRGFVIYQYEVNKKKYQITNRIMKNRETNLLSAGNKVDICFCKSNPKQAFIKRLYQ